MPVTVLMAMMMSMFMFMAAALLLTVMMSMFVAALMPMLMLLMSTMSTMSTTPAFTLLILIMSMRRPFMNPKFHPFDGLALLPLEVHVEVTDLDLREFPLEGRWADPEITQRAHGHIAADA